MAIVIPALGTTLAYSTTEAGTYTVLANILSVNFPGATVESVETSNLGSKIQTFRPGRVDPGDATFELQFDPGDVSHLALRKYVTGEVDPVVLYWRVVAPTTPAKGEEFPGFLTDFGPAAEGADGNIEASATIKVSGPITAYTAV